MYDKDINPVLGSATDEELKPLVELIKKKWSNALHFNGQYKKDPDHPSKYPDWIAKEIRKFGGNTFANLCRGGEGPSYHEVVSNVAEKLKVSIDAKDTVEEMEDKICEKIAQMDPKQRENLYSPDLANILKGLAACYTYGLALLFSGPAYETTIPAVLYVAALRRKQIHRAKNS